DIDREKHLVWYDARRARRNLYPTHRTTGVPSELGGRFHYLEGDLGRTAKSVAPTFHGSRPGMRVETAQPDFDHDDALHSGYDANRETFPFQHRPLLDMDFIIGGHWLT